MPNLTCFRRALSLNPISKCYSEKKKFGKVHKPKRTLAQKKCMLIHAKLHISKAKCRCYRDNRAQRCSTWTPASPRLHPPPTLPSHPLSPQQLHWIKCRPVEIFVPFITAKTLICTRAADIPVHNLSPWIPHPWSMWRSNTTCAFNAFKGYLCCNIDVIFIRYLSVLNFLFLLNPLIGN